MNKQLETPLKSVQYRTHFSSDEWLLENLEWEKAVISSKTSAVSATNAKIYIVTHSTDRLHTRHRHSSRRFPDGEALKVTLPALPSQPSTQRSASRLT
ncbi:hypothetical protein E2C01_047181 [Portunus trituberculatus]|uniref:Uncharacterized protein n=1 Tax=Portunus trituberculatus TaxID=210409 RepID=A0A5B7G2Y1_PORTR|nr:hypothetical protein [Portunus trituberculatus]